MNTTAKKMTKRQAQRWAREKWGTAGLAVRAKPAIITSLTSVRTGLPLVIRHPCLVGVREDAGPFGPALRWWGHGPDWAAAVADAERRLAACQPAGFLTGNF